MQQTNLDTLLPGSNLLVVSYYVVRYYLLSYYVVSYYL
jgi:hypothetical protein